MADIIKELSKYNPLKNRIKFKDGCLTWQIDPVLNLTPEVLQDFLLLFKKFGATKIRLQFSKEFKEKDIKLDFILNGKAEVFQKGFDEDNFFYDLTFTKTLSESFKDQDVSVFLNIKGSGYQFVSPQGMDDFKVQIGLKIKY